MDIEDKAESIKNSETQEGGKTLKKKSKSSSSSQDNKTRRKKPKSSSSSQDNKKNNSENYYCGIGKVPNGKVLAPPEWCLANGQARYWGVKAIDPKLLEKMSNEKKIRVRTLKGEQTKMLKISFEIELLLKKYNANKRVLENPKSTNVQIKKAEKQEKIIIKNKDVLLKKVEKQSKIIERLKREEKYTRSSSSSSESESKTKSKNRSKSTKAKSRKVSNKKR